MPWTQLNHVVQNTKQGVTLATLVQDISTLNRNEPWE